MSDPTPIRVIIDNRMRLLGTALAATSFPQQAQARKRHHAHAHARSLTKHLTDRGMTTHPAIVALQGMLDQDTPLEALFTLVMLMTWETGLPLKAAPAWMPENFNQQLWDFYEAGEIESLWQDEHNGKPAWSKAEAQAQNAFNDVYFKEVLTPFVGEIDEEFVFMPNVSYPADRNLGIRVGNRLIAIVPPPLAWGESAPWPYDEDTRLGEHTYPAALSQYARLLMKAYFVKHADQVSEASRKPLPVNDTLKARHPTWEDQFIALFMSAVVAIYLEDYVSATEARGYLLMERKVRNMTILPGTISVLRRYLQERGNKFETLADFLSVFPIQLKVARKIVTL